MKRTDYSLLISVSEHLLSLQEKVDTLERRIDTMSLQSKLV